MSADPTDGGARPTRRLLWLVALAVLCVAGSLLLGRYPGPYFTPPSTFLQDDLAKQLLLHIRLPRVLMAFLMGMTLSAAGTVLQMIFRNPLVDAGFLGVSQGAAFGASLAIVALGGTPMMIQGCAALFAFAGLAGSYLFAQRVRLGDSVLRLVLSGIAVSAIYSAGTGVLKYIADPLKQLPDITFWMLGGLWAITWPDLLQVLPVVLPCMILVYLMRWRLNLLSLREETAFSLGAAPARERLALLLAAVAATAVVVSKSGLVGWIGLIVPHIARRLLGSDAQRVLPGSMLIGGLFALFCDNIARTALPGEIPLGILTSFLGAGLFILLLMHRELGVRR